MNLLQSSFPGLTLRGSVSPVGLRAVPFRRGWRGRKALAVLCAAVLLAGSLSACGGETSAFPDTDLYDGETGLYFCPHTGGGTVIPEDLRDRVAVRHSEDGNSTWFFDRQAGGQWQSGSEEDLQRLQILTLTSQKESKLPDDAPELAERLSSSVFFADHVAFLSGKDGDADYQDSVSGLKFTIPAELADGLVLFSAQNGTLYMDADSETTLDESGSVLLCLHREMLGQIPIQQAFRNHSGVFVVDTPEKDRHDWSFGWERAYAWAELSDPVRKQCGDLKDALSVSP